jgi:F0F1-type ATP synthase membrane subunit c/vacuolar-type H+-ATPase subunit K
MNSGRGRSSQALIAVIASVGVSGALWLGAVASTNVSNSATSAVALRQKLGSDAFLWSVSVFLGLLSVLTFFGIVMAGSH